MYQPPYQTTEPAIERITELTSFDSGDILSHSFNWWVASVWEDAVTAGSENRCSTAALAGRRWTSYEGWPDTAYGFPLVAGFIGVID